MKQYLATALKKALLSEYKNRLLKLLAKNNESDNSNTKIRILVIQFEKELCLSCLIKALMIEINKLYDMNEIIFENTNYCEYLSRIISEEVVENIWMSISLDTCYAKNTVKMKNNINERLLALNQLYFGIEPKSDSRNKKLHTDDYIFKWLKFIVFNKYSFIINLALSNKKRINDIIKEHYREKPRNILTPERESYKRYMGFCKDMINNSSLTPYNIAREFCARSMLDNKIYSQKSVENAFRDFLKNHKNDIISEFKISEKDYLLRFNKKKLPK